MGLRVALRWAQVLALGLALAACGDSGGDDVPVDETGATDETGADDTAEPVRPEDLGVEDAGGDEEAPDSGETGAEGCVADDECVGGCGAVSCVCDDGVCVADHGFPEGCVDHGVCVAACPPEAVECACMPVDGQCAARCLADADCATAPGAATCQFGWCAAGDGVACHADLDCEYGCADGDTCVCDGGWCALAADVTPEGCLLDEECADGCAAPPCVCHDGACLDGGAMIDGCAAQVDCDVICPDGAVCACVDTACIAYGYTPECSVDADCQADCPADAWECACVAGACFEVDASDGTCSEDADCDTVCPTGETCVCVDGHCDIFEAFSCATTADCDAYCDADVICTCVDGVCEGEAIAGACATVDHCGDFCPPGWTCDCVGGFCAATACAEDWVCDSFCGEGQACACVDGGCVVTGCTTDHGCLAGCPEGALCTCVDGACDVELPEIECTVESDCVGNPACGGLACVCVAGSCAPPGAACATNADCEGEGICPAGWQCACANETCVLDTLECADTAECEAAIGPGLGCNPEGLCQPTCGEEQPCFCAGTCSCQGDFCEALPGCTESSECAATCPDGAACTCEDGTCLVTGCAGGCEVECEPGTLCSCSFGVCGPILCFAEDGCDAVCPDGATCGCTPETATCEITFD